MSFNALQFICRHEDWADVKVKIFCGKMYTYHAYH